MKIGPIAKPSAGSGERRRPPRAPARLGADPVMNRRRVTVSPSKAPGIRRSSVYLDLCFARLSGTEPRTISRRDSGRRRDAPSRLCASPRSPRGRPRAPAPSRARARSLEPQPTARAPAPQTASASSGAAGALRERAERDRVGQLGHRQRVAELDQPGQADRVQPVAGQQPQIGVAARAPRAARRNAAGSPRRSPRPAARTPRACPPREVPAATRGRAGTGARPACRRHRRGIRPDELAISPPALAQQRAQPLSADRPGSALCGALIGRPPASARHANAAAAAPPACARSARRCGPATETTPRTATAAGRRRAPAARDTMRRSASMSHACASANGSPARALKNTVSSPGTLTTCTG